MQIATRLWVRVPAAAKYFFISMFNMGIITQQELKLQDIKICDGVVFSRYSWAQCFATMFCDQVILIVSPSA